MRKLFVTGLIVLAFALFGSQAFAKNDGGTRPGWGLGDTNHVHTGPPGQSVHPTQNNYTNTEVNLSVEANSGNNYVGNNRNGTFSTGNASATATVNVSAGNNSMNP